VRSPLCTCCGEPFSSREGPDHFCEQCLRRARHFRRARALAVYDGCLAALIQSFKYRGKVQLARPLGALLLGAFGFYWGSAGVDLIVPVPLHRSRLRRRGFNQALLLIDRWPSMARAGAASLGSTAIEPRVLRRLRPTPPQTGLQRRERRHNLRGVFGLKDANRVKGRRVLLVDDVLTTGATADECARVLVQAGARWVDVLTLARTAAGGSGAGSAAARERRRRDALKWWTSW
jgi:ComF family protein